jgi:hypothetical protein
MEKVLCLVHGQCLERTSGNCLVCYHKCLPKNHNNCLDCGHKFDKEMKCMVSWYFEDSSHRDCLLEGLVGEQRRVRLEIGQVTTQHLPRFKALLAEDKTPTSYLSLYYHHTVAYSAP